MDNDLFRARNYKLCTAIDMIKLGIVLQEMVDSGDLDERLANAYREQASGLLQVMRIENNRVFKSSKGGET